ncbi:YcgL domain-containing protein [Spongiibacter sp. KMU-158]|uniref:YcgL domain-containing protein IB286_05765 n=1 Tax=Spongiibacter pelagi TaxID=2760804 RepID=A0A927GVC1_9GAMM|nr:YcgL domain-containing protein [Spongiibacter pelagi]MBD2858511.1 YcgL domain-containing protein [Spongiibacter pelagi]
MKRICSVFRSASHEGMYLYVDKAEALTRVPEPLLKRFGRAEHAMVLLLDAEKKLARADAAKVLEAIAEQGFYLQLPPQAEVLNPREDRPE